MFWDELSVWFDTRKKRGYLAVASGALLIPYLALQNLYVLCIFAHGQFGEFLHLLFVVCSDDDPL